MGAKQAEVLTIPPAILEPHEGIASEAPVLWGSTSPWLRFPVMDAGEYGCLPRPGEFR